MSIEYNEYYKSLLSSNPLSKFSPSVSTDRSSLMWFLSRVVDFSRYHPRIIYVSSQCVPFESESINYVTSISLGCFSSSEDCVDVPHSETMLGATYWLYNDLYDTNGFGMPKTIGRSTLYNRYSFVSDI